MEDDNTCNGDGGGNGFGVEDSQWTLQAVDNQDSNNSRRQFVGDFFKESRHLPLFKYQKRKCADQKGDTGCDGDQQNGLRQLLSSFGLCKGCDK